MGKPSCPLDLGNTINAPDNFQECIQGTTPTLYPRGSTTTTSREAEQLAPEYCNGP